MKFVPNPAFVAEMEAEAQPMLANRAQEAKQQAEAVAPDVTGYYRSRFTLTHDGEKWVLHNVDPFAHLVEFGSIHNQPYAPLRRGVVAAGLHLREIPKP